MPTRLSDRLLTGLIDDAAVFPPGLAPLPRAVSEHLARVAYRGYVGPLLVPATAAADVVTLAAGRAIRVGLIARPGAPVGPVRAGIATLAGSCVQVTGVEVGAASDWAALTAESPADVTVTVEIPRDGFDEALDAVAAAAHEQPWGTGVQAKFRTGPTEVWAWPDEAELAAFLAGCVARDLPFKLTGGLHHVLRADHPGPDGGPQHGLLNVLAALTSVVDGGDAAGVAEVLAERTVEPLAAMLLALSAERVELLRSFFRAYGCCDVLDPIRELVALDLVPAESDPGSTPTDPAPGTGAPHEE